MKQTLTAIKPKVDPTGNYSLEVTNGEGTKSEVLIPPAMEHAVMLTIQENLAVRLSKLSALAGFLVIDVLRSAPGDAPDSDRKALLIETKQLGAWALRAERAQLEQMIADLEQLLANEPPVAH